MADVIDTAAPAEGQPADVKAQVAPGADTVSGGDTLAGGQDTVAGGEKAGYWPEDWRAKLAGQDEKLGKQLQRFQSPADVVKSWREAQKLISSGEYKKAALDPNASPEDIAEFRKDRGIPETADGYLEKLPDGLVIGDDDKPGVKSFLETAHAKHAPKEFVEAALGWYQEEKERQITEQVTADKQFKAAAEDELREEWGNEYRANLVSAMTLLDQMPELEDGTSVKDLFMGGRLADGTPIGNHPGVLRWLTRMAAEINPGGFVAPSMGGKGLETIEAELASIQKMMVENRPAYDKDQALQARHLQLIDAQLKLKARG